MRVVTLWRNLISRATISLPSELLDELMYVTEAGSKTAAVMTAIKDEIRTRKLERIRRMVGKMEFVKTAEELRHGDARLG